MKSRGWGRGWGRCWGMRVVAWRGGRARCLGQGMRWRGVPAERPEDAQNLGLLVLPPTHGPRLVRGAAADDGGADVGAVGPLCEFKEREAMGARDLLQGERGVEPRCEQGVGAGEVHRRENLRGAQGDVAVEWPLDRALARRRGPTRVSGLGVGGSKAPVGRLCPICVDRRGLRMSIALECPLARIRRLSREVRGSGPRA